MSCGTDVADASISRRRSLLPRKRCIQSLQLLSPKGRCADFASSIVCTTEACSAQYVVNSSDGEYWLAGLPNRCSYLPPSFCISLCFILSSVCRRMGQQVVSHLPTVSCEMGSSDSELERRLPQGPVVKRREKRFVLPAYLTSPLISPPVDSVSEIMLADPV